MAKQNTALKKTMELEERNSMNGTKITPVVLKKTIDIPKDLFLRVMKYSTETELYKFTPAVLMLLEKALDIHEAQDGRND